MTEKDLRPENIKWDELGFDYINTDYRYLAEYKDGQWQEGKLVEDNVLHIAEGSTALHYGQNTFEGLKAFRQEDGKINIFRPYENAKRMVNSAERLAMEPYPVDAFVEAVKQTVKANADWVPPYGSGASLYIRPLLIGVGDNIGVKPASEYLFTIFVMPVGPYYPDGMKPTKFVTTTYDRAAPQGTGAAKVGGNYGGSLIADAEAQEKGFGGAIFLDPRDHKYIEEVGSANFFGITENDEYVTPESDSVLPGITNKSLRYLAENELGLKVSKRKIAVEEFENFTEAGACGTAAVITPVAGIQVDDKYVPFYSEEEAGPVTQKLYDLLLAIQYGDVEPPEEDWIVQVD